MRKASSLFRTRLCFLGAPGSGKGSYGKILSLHWNLPIITVSEVLKQQRGQPGNNGDSGIVDDDNQHKAAMTSGKLVNDNVVSEALLNYFSETSSHEFILDGFPRTIQQVEIMNQTWPQHLKLQAAVHLKVPLDVCERKLLGRRICTLCGNNYNVHGVVTGGFDLPPKLPRAGECHFGSQTSIHGPHSALSRCDASSRHWIQRDDDQCRDIIHQRLELYQQHSQPIFDYFAEKQRLFEFVPYKGFEDTPTFQSQLEDWLRETLPESAGKNKPEDLGIKNTITE